MKTGNTRSYRAAKEAVRAAPQWSPVMKTGNTIIRPKNVDILRMPQWSPVMKTGNTARLLRCRWLPVLHTLARTATRHPQPMGGSAGRVDKNQP